MLTRQSHRVEEVRSQDERETGGGWSYRMTVANGAGAVRACEVTLSWVDADHWSGGASSPSRVAESVVRYLFERVVWDQIPDKFDCATVRRWLPDLESELPACFGG